MSLKKILKPLTFHLIEEGRLAKSLDEEITRARRELLEHVNKYGAAQTTKSKAKVVLEIVLEPENAEDGSYSVTGTIKTTVPGRPAMSTLALASVDQDGEETLFVRASGSSADPPRQMKLATDDGRAIDPETQEPLPPKKPAADEKENA